MRITVLASRKVDQPNLSTGVASKSGSVTATQIFLRFMTDLRARTGGDSDFVEESGYYLVDDVSKIIMSTTTAGVWPTDTTEDLTISWVDRSGTVIASRVLRGTFSAGLFTITAVSNTEITGVSTAYVLTGDGTGTVRATVTLTLANGSTRTGVRTWTTRNTSVAGVTRL